MSKVDLTHTKQNRQINDLRNRLEGVGWKIGNEVERVFKGKPKWRTNDKTPNLIYSWSIRRNPSYNSIWLDFIAWWNYRTYEIDIHDCSHCQIRGQGIQLDFAKDKSSGNDRGMLDWKNKLDDFLNRLNEIEVQYIKP